MRNAVLLLSAMLLLSACATDQIGLQRAPVQPPQLPLLVQEPLGPSFTERMANFLRGKLPAPTPSAPRSGSVTPSTTRPAR